MHVISYACDSYRADNCSFWWKQSNNLSSLFPLFKIVIEIATVLIFFWYNMSVWKLPINVEGGRKTSALNRKMLWKIKFGGCCSGTAAGRSRCIVQHSGIGDAWIEWTAEFFNTGLELKSSYFCTESFVVVSWEIVATNVTRTWYPTIRFSFCSNKCNPLSPHTLTTWKQARADSVCI